MPGKARIWLNRPRSIFKGVSPEQIIQPGYAQNDARSSRGADRNRIWNLQLIVYRLHRDTRQPFEISLNRSNRWNPARTPMLYCAANVSLCCLEVLVHTGSKHSVASGILATSSTPDCLWQKRSLTVAARQLSALAEPRTSVSGPPCIPPQPVSRGLHDHCREWHQCLQEGQRFRIGMSAQSDRSHASVCAPHAESRYVASIIAPARLIVSSGDANRTASCVYHRWSLWPAINGGPGGS